MVSRSNDSHRLAAEYDLRLNYVKEFHEVFSENSDHRDFGPLLQHMKVVDSNGESQMDEDQWEAASTYIILHAASLSKSTVLSQIFILHFRSKKSKRDNVETLQRTKRFYTVLSTNMHARGMPPHAFMGHVFATWSTNHIVCSPNIPVVSGELVVVYVNVKVYDKSSV